MSHLPYKHHTMQTFKTYFERAYHGTPHDIVGSFDLNRIGSGEGNQAFGWGLYFADETSVASSYRPDSYKGTYRYHGKSGLEWMQYFENRGEYGKASVWESILLHQSRDKILAKFDPDEVDTIDYVKSLPDTIFSKPGGNLYEVNIHVNDEDLIPWDDYVGEYDAPTQRVNAEIKRRYGHRDYIQGGQKGSALYVLVCKVIAELENKLEQFGTQATKNEQKLGSAFFSSIGIKGIKYKDSISRDFHTPNPTYNYVIFDPSVIEIVSKNGEMVMKTKSPDVVEVH